MLEALTITLAVLLVCSCAGWSWFNVRASTQVLSQTQAFQLHSRMNDELEARVKNRIKIVNAGIAVPVERQLGSGVVVNAGADSLSEDQPPISMSAILDDTHEIERELSRFIRPDTEYSKRENFADYEDV